MIVGSGGESFSERWRRRRRSGHDKKDEGMKKYEGMMLTQRYVVHSGLHQLQFNVKVLPMIY